MENEKKKLDLNYDSFFMNETSQFNPYGPNYYYLAYDTKVYNKFILMKKFTQFSKEDSEKLLWANIFYFSGMFFSVVCGLSLGVLAKKAGSRISYKIADIIKNHPQIYYLFFSFSGVCVGYSFLNDYYIMNVCNTIMNKYIDDAKKNGFEDYEVDETNKNKTLAFYIRKYMNYF